MGFFSNLKKEEDMSFDNSDVNLEEQYQKLYKKIARDFVHVKDFEEIINSLNSQNLKLKNTILLLRRENAILKAVEYKNNLEKPRTERKTYSDILDSDNE